MEVYRICNKDEVDQILNGEDISNIGTLGSTFIKYNDSRTINNHSYDPSEKYMHFFEQKGSIVHWHPDKGRYVCTYNIPDEILRDNKRYGKYISVFDFERTVDVVEYAILSKRIKKEYITRIELLKEDIDICDDDFYYSLDEFYELVYKKDSNNMKLSKKKTRVI